MWAVTPQADFNAQADKSIAFDFKCKHIYCLVVLCFWTDCDLLVFFNDYLSTIQWKYHNKFTWFSLVCTNLEKLNR